MIHAPRSTPLVAYGVLAVGTYAVAVAYARWATAAEGSTVTRRLHTGTTVGYLAAILLGFFAALPTGLVEWMVVAIETNAAVQGLPGRTVLVIAAVAFGPSFLLVACVFLGVAPAWRTFRDYEEPFSDTAKRFVVKYALLVVPVLAFFWLVLVLPAGVGVGVAVASAYVSYQAALPWLAERVNDTRSPTDAERETVAPITGSPSVRVIEASENRAATAMAVGFLPGYSRIYVTDYLLDELPVDAAAAVVAHETAHHRHHHVVAHVGIDAVLVGAAGAVVSYALVPGLLAVLVAATPVVLGVRALQRHNEYVADAHAADATSPDAAVAALDSLADLNVLPTDAGRLRRLVSKYPTIDRRVRRLRASSE